MASAEPLAPPSARELFARMRGRRILVVGDLMIDEWIWGDVNRISPEAPVPVVAVRRHTFTLGGAGNVANNLRALGADVSFIGVVGHDAEGERAKELFREIRVDASDLFQANDRPTTRKTRIVAHNQQVVRADWESTLPLNARDNAALAAKIKTRSSAVDAVILSDYAKGLFSREVVEAALAAPITVADPKPANINCFQHVTCVAPNTAEAAQITSIPEALRGHPEALERAADQLFRRLGCRYVLITQGSAGMTLFSNDDEPHHVRPAAKRGDRMMYDVSGAGDTAVATLTLAMAAGAPILTAVMLANFAAGVVVEKVGTATASPDEIIALLEANPH